MDKLKSIDPSWTLPVFDIVRHLLERIEGLEQMEQGLVTRGYLTRPQSVEHIDKLREIEKLRELEALYRTFLNRAAPYLDIHGFKTGTNEEVARAAELRVELGIEGVSS